MCSCMDVEFPVENAEEQNVQNVQKDVNESSIDNKDGEITESVDLVSDSKTTDHATTMSNKKVGKQSVRFVKLTPVNEVDPDL